MSLQSASATLEDSEILRLRRRVEELQLQNEQLSRRVKADDLTPKPQLTTQGGLIGMGSDRNAEAHAGVLTSYKKDLSKSISHSDPLQSQFFYAGDIENIANAEHEKTDQNPERASLPRISGSYERRTSPSATDSLKLLGINFSV